MQGMNFDPEKMELVSTGVEQEVNPTRQIHNRDELLADMAYHVKAQTHYWVVILQHRAGDSLLDAMDGKEGAGTPHLDADSMVGMPATVCLVCEKKYEPQLRRRKCGGEPK